MRREDEIFTKSAKKIAIIFILIFVIAAPIVYFSNTNAEEIIEESISKYESDSALFKAEIKRLNEIQEMYKTTTYLTEVDNLKIASIKEYFNKIGGAGVLNDQASTFVEISKVYEINPFRTVSIALHESAKGSSYATKKQRNISGMNNNSGEYTDIYNLKVYSSIEESIHHLIFKLKTLYKDKWGLETLSEIQKKYAPISDPRQGLDGMDNTIWFKSTSKHYYAINNIYQSKLRESGIR